MPFCLTDQAGPSQGNTTQQSKVKTYRQGGRNGKGPLQDRVGTSQGIGCGRGANSDASQQEETETFATSGGLEQ